MQLQDLSTFLTVAAERSFSAAAKKLHRTQPAVSQGIRRLEEELGERLFDRSSRNGTLTEAGRLLQDYAARLMRVAADAAIGDSRAPAGPARPDRHRRQRSRRPLAAAVPRAVLAAAPAGDGGRPARRRPGRLRRELLNRSLDFGVLTFQPAGKGLQSIPLWRDELVLLTHPGHPLAARRRVSLEEVGRQVVIAHNDPSPARERVLRLYERRHAPINIHVSLPSLDGIKRAVEMGLGVARAAATVRADRDLARASRGDSACPA